MYTSETENTLVKNYVLNAKAYGKSVPIPSNCVYDIVSHTSYNTQK
jgi:hypothetical protein